MQRLLGKTKKARVEMNPKVKICGKNVENKNHEMKKIKYK